MNDYLNAVLIALNDGVVIVIPNSVLDELYDYILEVDDINDYRAVRVKTDTTLIEIWRE